MVVITSLLFFRIVSRFLSEVATNEHNKNIRELRPNTNFDNYFAVSPRAD